MLQYYTLEQAARLLGMSTEETKGVLDKHKVRAYRDGSNVRYLTSNVEEVARSLGQSSDPGLQLGESTGPKAGTSAAPGKPTADKPAPDVFAFDLGAADGSDQIDLGVPPPAKAGDSPRSGGPGSRGKGSSSSTPKPSSDSDVRLVVDTGDDALLAPPSRAGRAPETPTPSKVGPKDAGPLNLPPRPGSDSDVRMVPDSAADNVVPIGEQPAKRHSDSDIRLEEVDLPPRANEGSDDSMVTEEIDLDAEQRKAEEAERSKIGTGKKKHPGTTPLPPKSSPFELSEADLDLSAGKPAPSTSPEDSSDIDLTPGGLMAPSGSDYPLAEEEVPLGEATAGAGRSGINLQKPADSGISLEGGGSQDSVEFELSLDSNASPAPTPAKPDSSSEFELSLEDSSADQPAAPAEPDSDSEFELSLEDSSGERPAAAAEPDSDSEFELTLDDSGGLVPLEKDAEGQDIFETDFEVPPLEDESGSEAVALDDADTDLESSEFDLALGEQDLASDEESGSQVVALDDEEEADPTARTVARSNKRSPILAEEEEPVDQLIQADEEEETAAELEGEEAAVPRRKAAAAAPPAPWGALPALILLPCVVVLLLAGMMGHELIHGMWGYQQPNKVTGFLTDSVARMFFPDDLPQH